MYTYGTVDLALTASDGNGLLANQQRRGDSPYNHLQLNLFADIVVDRRLTVFSQLTVDPSTRASLTSYLRTWARYTLIAGEGADMHLQLGIIPTPFGSFTERSYSTTNPLLGYPLMYHHFSSLRSNQLPADNADLLGHRGQGMTEYFTGYAGSGAAPRAGLPMVYDSCWDFGGGVLGSLWRLEYLVAVTQGTLSDPRTNAVDTNDGQQLAVRLGYVPFPGLLVRTSYARGPYLDESVAPDLAVGQRVEDYLQEIVGLAVEFEHRHLAVVGELAANRWESPHIVDGVGRAQDLDVNGFYLEGRYKLSPGLQAAARYSGLRFGDIDDGTGSGRRVGWDRDADRFEVGLGYWLTDGVLGRLVGQLNDLNHTSGGDDHVAAAKLTVQF